MAKSPKDRLMQAVMNLPCKDLHIALDHPWGYMHGHRDARHASAEAIAAILSEQEAEDALSVTEEWLRSIGFVYDDEWDATYCYGYHSIPLSYLYDDCKNQWSWGEAMIPVPKTRGDVLLLCRALGIEVNP